MLWIAMGFEPADPGVFNLLGQPNVRIHSLKPGSAR
jgi:hypothetical protein